VNIEELYETDKYTVHTVPVSNGELVLLLPRCSSKHTVLILPESDCRKFILLAVLLVKNLFKVVLACPHASGVEPSVLGGGRLIFVVEKEGKVHVVCRGENSMIDLNYTLDNVLKILNKVVECRDRESSTLHRVKQ